MPTCLPRSHPPQLGMDRRRRMLAPGVRERAGVCIRAPCTRTGGGRAPPMCRYLTTPILIRVQREGVEVEGGWYAPIRLLQPLPPLIPSPSRPRVLRLASLSASHPSFPSHNSDFGNGRVGALPRVLRRAHPRGRGVGRRGERGEGWVGEV
jgi:hypothetical protein